MNFNRIKELEEENRVLKSEIQRLNILLEKAGVYNVASNIVPVEITLANQVYIANLNIKARAVNQFRRLAAFSNPEFYKKQAMGFSTNGIPRIIHSGSDTDEYVCLPRGLEDKMVALLDESDITYKLTDEKQTGNKVNVEFIGILYPEQEKAATSMLQYDYGILGAATGFGKTVIGAYLIAQRKVNALVLVQNLK